MSNHVWLGLDVGGTNAKVALVDDTGIVVAHCQEPLVSTRPGPMLQQLYACASRCLREYTSVWTLDGVVSVDVDAPLFRSVISGIGVGCCHGTIDHATGKVYGAANLHADWEGYSLRDKVRRTFNVHRVVLLPDCAAVAKVRV